MQICVIGAGVLGLSIAYELSTRGHEVVVLEKRSPFAGASHRSFAWINANNKQPATYHRINALGVAEHQRFQEKFPSDATWLHMSGNILVDFSSNRAETYAARLHEAEESGYVAQKLSRSELETQEPAILWPRDLDSALYFPDEGYLDNDILANELLKALDNRDVPIERVDAQTIEGGSGRVTVQTAGRSREFDQTVIAAGAESREIAESSGFPLPVADLSAPSQRTHSLLGLTEPTDIELKHVVTSDRINVRPRHDGRLWVQTPQVEHRVSEGESPELLQQVGATMQHELHRLFGARVPVQEVIFSGRSFPEDGVSIIGYLDGPQRVYCAVTHSGMTLAPLFGRLTADELEGRPSDLLTDFRPSRFFNGVSHVDEEYFIGKQ